MGAWMDRKKWPAECVNTSRLMLTLETCMHAVAHGNRYFWIAEAGRVFFQTFFKARHVVASWKNQQPFGEQTKSF